MGLNNSPLTKKAFAALSSVIILLSFGLSSCKPSQSKPTEEIIEEIISPARTEVVTKYKTVTEVKQEMEYMSHLDYPEDGYVTMYPEETIEVLNNPNSGMYVIENAPMETVNLGRVNQWEDVNAMAILSSWGEIEKHEGVYDWTQVDAAVNYWISKGKRIVFRISTDAMVISGLMRYVTEVPAYLFDKYNVAFENREMQGVFYRVPDYANEKFLERQEKFLNAFAARYKNNPSVEGVMLLGYGPWGEWHSGHSFTSYDQREKTLARIIKIWSDAWGPNMPLFLSSTYEYDTSLFPAVTNPKSFEEFKRWSAFDYAWELPNVSFARNGVAGALKQYDSRLLMDSFYSGKRTPVQLELYAGYVEFSQLGGYAGFDADSAAQEILMYHANVMTVMGWDLYGAPRFFEERPDLVYKLNRYLGYRLVPKSVSYPATVSAGSKFEMNHTWTNDGVGRSYKDYDLTVYFAKPDGTVAHQYTDTSFKPSNMTYGNIYTYSSNISVPKSLAAGDYQVKIALTDNKGKPAIELGITGNDGQKRYVIGQIQVKKQAKAQNSQYAKGFRSEKTIRIESGKTTNVDAKFKAGKSYEISFDYQTLDKDATVSFSVSRKNGEKQSAKAVNSWMDVSQLVSRKTFIVSLENYNDYVLQFGVTNGNAQIGNILVREVSAVFSENFEADSLDKIQLAFDEDVSLIKDKEKVLGGSQSLQLLGSGVDSVDKISTYSEAIAFKPNTTYTVSFDYQTLTNALSGSYMYMQLANGETVRSSHFWSDLVSNGRRTQTFTFTTDADTEYTLLFGVHKALSVTIDNLVVVENGPSVRIRSKGANTATPQRNDEVSIKSFPVKVDFEEGNIYKSGMLSGDMSFGEITSNKQAVLGGKFSVIGNNDGSVLWMNYLNTDTRKISFKKNTTYTIAFDTKTVRKQHVDGGFMVYLRTNLGTFNDDRGYLLWNAYGDVMELGPDMSQQDVNVAMNKDGSGRIDMRVTTGNKDDYSLTFCIKYGGALSIDNLTIKEDNSFVKKTITSPSKTEIKLPVFGFSETFEAGPMRGANGGFFRRTMLNGGEPASRDFGFYSEFTTDPSKVISGHYSVWGDNTKPVWYDFLKTNSARIPLYDGNDYYIRFKYKPANLANGAHYALTLKSDSNPEKNDYLWFNDKGEVVGTNLSAINYKITKHQGYYAVELKITPKVGPGNYYLVWGINGIGSLTMDDFVISANDPTYNPAGLVTWETIVGKTLIGG